ncbi:hypothetical protein [Salinibacter grassmerensis]|uniref:hypothetical protein n=1 Tax=Salinibacter grassmerensis TaxID=3040353 RepID=UPI0021E7C557|nr:hypothetical protein [Salinibacter grassmerensis]
MNKVFAALLIVAFLTCPAKAQTDSVTVSTEALRNLKESVEERKRRVELQDSLIEEQARQIELYEEKALRDSTILQLTEKQLDIKDERIKARDERISRLEEQKLYQKIRSYVTVAGGLIIGYFIGA